MSKFKETAAFIAEHVSLISEKDHKGGKDKDGNQRPSRGKIKTFRVNQGQYLNFMSERGIKKEVITQLNEAQSEYNNGTLEFARTQMLENPEAHQVIINTTTPTGTVSTKMTRHYTTKNPGTGEVVEKYGDVSINISMGSHLDKDLLAKCAADIEAAMNK